MSSATFIWTWLPLIILLHGIYGPDDDPTVLGTYNQPTPDELDEAPHDYQLTSARKRRSLLSWLGKSNANLPETFRAGTTKWTHCKANVDEIAHQGKCGNCHSVCGASVISNRWCIALAENGLNHVSETHRGGYNDQISAYHVTACHDYFPATEPTDPQRCTDGSNQLRVFRHGVFEGYVTGGLYGSNKGCLPYPFEKKQNTPMEMTCPDKKSRSEQICTNTAKSYHQDFRKTDSYWNTNRDMIADKSVIVDLMKYEISTYGPIMAAVHFPVEDVAKFKRAKLVEKGSFIADSAKGDINHVVRIIGWDFCLDDIGAKLMGNQICWLVANSWGTNAHRNGILMIETGHNLLKIEESLSAPVIALKGDPCKAGDFQTKPIDAAIWIKDGLYLFQGHCAQRLKFTDGTVIREGPPDFVQRIFVGAPPGVAYTAIDPVKVGSSQEFVPVILDSRSEGVLIYRKGTRDHVTPVKYVCRWTHLKDYKPEPKAALWVEKGVVKKFGVNEFNQVAALTPKEFADINAILYVGEGSIAIFGQNEKKAFIAGVFTGLTPNSKYSWKLGPMPQSEFLKSVDDDGSPRDGALGREDSSKALKQDLKGLALR